MDRHNHTIQRGRPVTSIEAAHANEYFDPFLSATTLKNILGYHRSMCEFLHLKPNVYPLFYPKLKSYLNTWKAKALWKKFDARASHKCYNKGKICANRKVLIIGAGPCGLRTAIEAQLLGAKVVVIEKRDRLSRNNVLHLWPFVIEDLRALGAKKFFGKFCAGAIDHISIRQLQCILLKVALLLGVEIHTEVSFEKLIEPTDKFGWRAEFKPSDHPVSQYEFDVIIGADGKRNTLQGFKRKEFRGKLAIAITANFINKKTEAEARVEEISGVAFIFNQKFFKDLQEETRIDLENIVYYKDDTHYFVMTAKKPSLIEKGVIKQDFADTEKLLSPDNVNRDALHQYAKEAAEFSTNYQMLDLEFAVNHYGQPDVAMFDFTSMYAAENASKVIERNGFRLLMILVGDSLLEPFWPTGSGCARGFLSSLDAAWAIRSLSLGTFTALDVLAERESIYRLLGQTTPDNLNKDWKSYTLDPSTRYPNLNKNVVLPHQTICLYDTDNPRSIEKMRRNSTDAAQVTVPKKRRRGNVDNEILLSWVNKQIRDHDDIQISDISSIFTSGKVLCAIISHYRPDLLDYSAINSEDPASNNKMAFEILEEMGIPNTLSSEDINSLEDSVLIAYLSQVYDRFRGEIPHIKHPKVELPESNKKNDFSLKSMKPSEVPAFISSVPRPSSRHKRHADAMSHNKLSSIDRKTRKRRTIEKVGTSVDHENKQPNTTRGNTDEEFAARIRNFQDKWSEPQPVDKKPKDLLRAIGKIETSDWNIKEIEKKIMENKLGKSVNKDKEKVPKWSKEQFLARQTKMEKQHLDRQDSAEAKYADIDKSIKYLDQKLREGTVRELGQHKVASITEKLTKKKPESEQKPVEKSTPRPPLVLPTQGGSEFCHFCGKQVYHVEQLTAEGRYFHRGCFKCQYCNTHLRLGSYAFDRDGLYGHKFFCIHHFGMKGEINQVTRKESQRLAREAKSPDKSKLRDVTGVDLLDRVQTPERIEFSNLSAGAVVSDQEESLSQMDEDEWTDKNFGASCTELGSSEDESSSSSDTDSDDEDAFEEALEEPATKEGTLKWVERLKKRYSRKRADSDSENYSSSDQSSYYENTSDDDESDTATEGEDEIRARELRKQEVRVEPPVVQTDTGTDTEVLSDESSSDSSGDIQNSATEISTDSEFAHDDPTPTREIPSIVFNDFNVTKTRGSSSIPKKIQVKTGYLQKPINGKAPKQDIELKLEPLVPSAPIIKKPALRTENYALSRTQSTGGMATKMSLELKRKYLLGEASSGNIQKSGSASTLDTKFKSFVTNISDCQKMLKPASDLSSSMFKLNEPILSPSTSHVSLKQTEPKANEKVEISKEHAPVSGNLPPPDVTEVVNQTTEQVIDSEQPAPTPVFENESEGRPRSPLHETSIIVPKFDWSKKEHSHSDDSLSSMSSGRDQVPNFHFENIPRVEVHTANDDDIPPDSLCLEAELKKSEIPKIDNQSSISSEPPKSITSEKKTLNQPKSLPNLDGMALEIHNSLHHKPASDEIKNESPENEVKSIKNSSGRSSPDSCLEQATAALTETELSDWARDGAVSDDLDEDFEFQRDTENKRGYKKPKELPEDLNRTIAKISEFDDNGHICGKDKKIVETKNEILIDSNVLNADLDNIDFMDTGTETSSDDGTGDGQDGYVRFQNEDETEDSLNPNINEITETKNPCMTDKTDVFPNTGFCYFADNNFGGEVVNLKPSDLEMRKQKQLNTEHEEDSLVIVETGTTTEENTCSDSTVKNVTELSADKIFNYNNKHIDNNNFQKQRLEEKLAKLKAEKALSQNNISEEIKKPVNKEQTLDANVEFVEHCQRLQSKVEFSNVKDSIDIRKSRRKSKSDSPQKPDLIQEEKDKFSPQHVKKDVTLNFTAIRSPDLLYNKQIIEKERDVNQKLVQEMVMNKMRAENKSLERKKRNRTIPSVLSPNRPYELSKSATTDVSQIKNLDKVSNRHSAYSTNANHYVTPDVLLTSNPLPLQRSQTVSSVPLASSKSTGSLATTSNVNTHPLSIHSTSNLTNDSPVKNSSLSLRKSSISDNFKTPKAPPRQKHEEAKRTAEKLKQDARARFRVLSNEELGLSPEDKFNKLKEKASKRGKENEKINPDVEESIESLVKNTEKRNSWLHSNTDLSMKKSNSFKRSNSGESYQTNKLSAFQDPCDKLSTPNRTKSIPEIPKDCLNKKSSNDKTDAMKICKSDPNLLDTDYKKSKKKSKDRDRRKSITKIINFISKKMPSSNNGSKSGIFSRLSPKMKDISKETVVEEPLRRKSVSEMSINKKIDDTVPPPVPPLPLNYTGITKYTDDSSDGEHEHNHDRSSCDTLDQSGVLETSVSSLTGRKSSSKSRRASRQAQLKRHRMAQEIQRKLEETEVKTRELEKRGVLIEKALRGENNEDSTKDESELLQEWFDLMRDRTELQRYEKELTIRAQELELEDRHARLQHELRERLENNEKKTQEDIQIEGSIVNEMLQIVAKRDSLITILEDDRLRYSNEDRDFEEQMLAKGLRLTPIRKSPEK